MGVNILWIEGVDLIPSADLFWPRVEGEEICSGPPIY